MSLNNAIRGILTVRLKPNKDTCVALGLGVLVILSSAGMLLFTGGSLADAAGLILLRDIIMICSLGFLAPLYYSLVVKKDDFKLFGIKKDKWAVSLLAGIVLTVLFGFLFYSEMQGNGSFISLTADTAGSIFYIMVTGIFEVVFFYAFLMRKLEDAFGVLPAIILAALFYSFHHIGFQPEFGKLIFVGILYAAVFRTTLNALIIYPFFWGIGACWDVLVQSEVVVDNSLSAGWLRGLIMLVLMSAVLIAIYALRKKNAGQKASVRQPAAGDT